MSKILRTFSIPIFVLGSIFLYFIYGNFIKSTTILNLYLWVGIFIGSVSLLKETYETLKRGSFALDYIALLAIGTGVVTENYLVASVIVLMMSGGNSLEVYAQEKATDSLKELQNKIPNEILVERTSGTRETVKIDLVELGSIVVVRKGEVVPLDGLVQSDKGEFDESSLTGEAIPVSKKFGELVRSGSVNVGELVPIKTTVVEKDSTFKKIVTLVSEAQSKKAPFIQLADKISGWFTLVSLIIAIFGYFYLGGIGGFLAVLVIATPCPLILAVPIALIGGVSASAKQRVVYRRLSALEILSRVKAIVFDKTGTLTLGVPSVKKLSIKSKTISEKKALEIASSLERNSYHPYAKAIIKYSEDRGVTPTEMTRIEEIPGQGLTGYLGSTPFRIDRGHSSKNSTAVLVTKNELLAEFIFDDELKSESLDVIKELLNKGISLSVFTGDTKERTQQMLATFSSKVTIVSDCKPEDKLEGVKKLKDLGYTTAMIGDGLNDAPALALSDVGMVFSHQEQTAATEASDVVLLNGNLGSVLRTIEISKRTMLIAKQSMYIGVGLSIIGMIFAALGYIPPIAGAVIQELIDVAVILNALRASVYKR